MDIKLFGEAVVTLFVIVDPPGIGTDLPGPDPQSGPPWPQPGRLAGGSCSPSE